MNKIKLHLKDIIDYNSVFVCVGTLTDIADVEKIIDNAKMLADIIEEIYLEKGGKLVHE